MPHAIYLHSSLARDRYGVPLDSATIGHLLRATRLDVALALFVAGTANVGMLILAGAALRGSPGTDSVEGAHAAIASRLGPGLGALFAIALLASGFASTAVGAYAGSSIMQGLLHRRIPLLTRRVVTIIPALAVIASGVSPTAALIVSQVALSLGIPFALIPLVMLTGSRSVMGRWRNPRLVQVAAWAAAALILVLNVTLVTLTIPGID